MNLGKLKAIMRENKTLEPLYKQLKKMKGEMRWKSKLRGKYVFENRSKGSDKVCIVLAGYKEFLYPAVFGRLDKYAPTDIDICIMTSGLYSVEMSKRCADKGWSYLSTKRNNVSLIQNIAIHLHPSAEYIFKLDEDIFITEGYFEKLIGAYHHADMGNYTPGIIAPLIPINHYGSVRLLEKLGLTELYTNLFERPKYSTDANTYFYASPKAARFFWGEGGYLPSIDEMNRQFTQVSLEERPCAVRFSIGAIMFTREFWNSFGQYSVQLRGGIGGNVSSDETEICSFCINSSHPIMVSENVLVGHLSFMPQNAEMKEFYLKNQGLFMAPD